MAEAATPTPSDPDIDAQQAAAEAAAAASLAAADADKQPEPNPEAEKVARLMNWKPLDQWKGDPANWRPAEEFLAEVPEILKHTRKTSQRQEEKFARLVGEVTRLTKLQERQLSADTETRIAAAVEANDLEGVKKIMAERDAARTPEPVEPPAFTAFKERNTWFGVDDIATAAVEALDRKFATEAGGPDKVTNVDAHFRKIEAELKGRFPDLFGAAETKERPKPPLVNRGGRVETHKANGEMTAADLSPTQRRAAEEMNVTPADYVKSLNKINARERASA